MIKYRLDRNADLGGDGGAVVGPSLARLTGLTRMDLRCGHRPGHSMAARMLLRLGGIHAGGVGAGEGIGSRVWDVRGRWVAGQRQRGLLAG